MRRRPQHDEFYLQLATDAICHQRHRAVVPQGRPWSHGTRYYAFIMFIMYPYMVANIIFAPIPNDGGVRRDFLFGWEVVSLGQQTKL